MISLWPALLFEDICLWVFSMIVVEVFFMLHRVYPLQNVGVLSLLYLLVCDKYRKWGVDSCDVCFWEKRLIHYYWSEAKEQVEGCVEPQAKNFTDFFFSPLYSEASLAWLKNKK